MNTFFGESFLISDCSSLARPLSPRPCDPSSAERCAPGQGQDRSISSLTRGVPHNARRQAGRARETVTTLQWAETRPGKRRLRGDHPDVQDADDARLLHFV